MVLLKTVSLFGLDLVHWIFALILPLILLILAVIAVHKLSGVKRRLVNLYRGAADDVRAGGKLEPGDEYDESFNEQIASYLEDGKKLFDDRYVPDPELYFLPDQLYDEREAKTLSYWPSTLFLILALFGLIGAAASLTAIPPAVSAQNLPVLLLPLSTGLALAVFVFFRTARANDAIQLARLDFLQALSTRLPVFRDKAGIAELINEMKAYDRSMGEKIEAFGETAAKLADGEFSRGIQESVRLIMSNEVTPPIQQAGEALSALAKELSERQERGMSELAESFSKHVATTLAKEMTPLTEQLASFRDQMALTNDYVTTTIGTMEAAREQNAALNESIRTALESLSESKRDMADEIENIRGHLALIGTTTEKMTALYIGEEMDLAAHINQLAVQLQNYATRLDTSVGESSKSLLAAAQLTERQDEAASIWLDRLDEQLLRLSEISVVLQQSATHFTNEAQGFMQKSLAEYDSGLAEVVERLTFTTAEIRDAVDALPQALRPGIS
jgi:hypothetical protein